MKPEILPADGFKYYACVLMYVDDILVVHHQAENALKEIDHFFKMKPGSIDDPDFYLRDKISWIVFPNGVVDWNMSSKKYIQSAVQNVQEYLNKNSCYSMLKRAPSPFLSEFKYDIDFSTALE